MASNSSRVTAIGVATDLRPNPSTEVDALAATSDFLPLPPSHASSMAAPSSLGVSKRFYVVSHLAGSQNEISPTEEKAKAIFEQVQVEFEDLCDKIRNCKGASFRDRAIDINVTRGTYRYVEDGITIEEPLEDLQTPADFISPSGSTDKAVRNEEYKKVVLDSLKKIETLLRESKAVNFGSATVVSTARPSSTYFGSSIELDSAATPSLGTVVKKVKKDGNNSLEYFPQIMEELLAAGAGKETLARVMTRFDNIQKYRNKFLEELAKQPDTKSDKNLVALSNAMREVDWFAVAVGIAFRELGTDEEIKKEGLEKAKKAIGAIAEKERSKAYEGKWISRIRSLPDVSETEERARLAYEARLADVISGEGQRKSVEEVLVTIAFMEKHRGKSSPWASVFDGIALSAAKAIKQCDDAALNVVTSTQLFELDDEIKGIVAGVDGKDPATLGTFVSQMSTRLREPPSPKSTELFDRDFHRATSSLKPNPPVRSIEGELSDGQRHQINGEDDEDSFGSSSRRRSTDSDSISLIDMTSDLQVGLPHKANGGQPIDLLN